MNSIILSFLACLGTSCQTVERPLEASLQECLIGGQVEVIRWQADHPGYVLKGGYRCSWQRRGDVA